MWGAIRSGVQGVDERLREQAARRADLSREAQKAAILQDLQGRMGGPGADPASVAASLSGYLGGPTGDYEKLLASRASGAERKRQLAYLSAAENSGPYSYGPLRYGVPQQLNQLLAGTDAASRAAQVGTYGAIGGGGVLGMTAAGQGLMNLMAHLQQGMEVQEERQLPLS